MKKIASGIFSWSSLERVSNRYGAISMFSTNYEGTAEAPVEFLNESIAALVGKKARLIARVLETRTSGHVGDLFLGIKPSTPNKGDEIEVGVGILRSDGSSIFLQPDDGRAELWIDPRVLYRLHDQTVALFAEETDLPCSPKADLSSNPSGAVVVEKDSDGSVLQFKTRIPVERIGVETPLERLGDGLFVSREPAVGERLDVFKKN